MTVHQTEPDVDPAALLIPCDWKGGCNREATLVLFMHDCKVRLSCREHYRKTVELWSVKPWGCAQCGGQFPALGAYLTEVEQI